jgi:tripartite-type tricarboxylate transporter receptor subunit TctC
MTQIRASKVALQPLSQVNNLLRARCLRLAALLAAMLLAATPVAGNAAYPVRAITVIVPFAAGGPTDIVARILADRLARTFGQQIIIENVTGAGGTTAAIRAKRATADGYTLLMGHMGTHGSAPAVYPHLAYDPVKDFAPIGLVVGMPVLLLAKKELPVQDFADLVRYVSGHPETTMAHAGVGSVSYATCSLLNSTGHFHPETKAFQGTGPALQALVAGRVDYMCDQIVSASHRVRTGDVRAVAILASRRSPILPDVPTSEEVGLPDFKISAWNALFAPKGTPPELIAALNAALGQALDDPEIRKELLDLGSEMPPIEERGPAALNRLVESEVARWKPHFQPAINLERGQAAP